ncbi:MAG: hypothetical protein PHN56_07090 [Candidatus Nanoarchaeia archaeon]|nr:hypothetical protein [Candidatus Nanoarchaeia archaeon]
MSNVMEIVNNFIVKEGSLKDLPEFQTEVEKVGNQRPKQLRWQIKQVFPGDFGEIIASTYGQFFDEELI